MAETTWLTQDSYDRLSAELKQLVEVERPAIAKRIDEARQEGDLKENGGYHAAREQQSWNETRIQQLQELLENAQVGETPADDGVVEAGMVVTVEMNGREMTFLVGTREAGIGLDIDVFSPDAPMGKAIYHHRIGDEVTYTAPNGKEITVTIKDAKPFAG